MIGLDVPSFLIERGNLVVGEGVGAVWLVPETELRRPGRDGDRLGERAVAGGSLKLDKSSGTWSVLADAAGPKYWRTSAR